MNQLIQKMLLIKSEYKQQDYVEKYMYEALMSDDEVMVHMFYMLHNDKHVG